METKVYDGVFEGGGVKGIAFAGALKRLEEEGVSFQRVAGTSAGSIIAALYAAGYRADEVKNILWDTDFTRFADPKKIFKGKWYKMIFRFFMLFCPCGGHGLFSTESFYLWIKELLKKNGVTTFSSVPICLRVFAVDVVKQDLLQFDDKVSPDSEVADAVRMSMSIPLFFRATVKEKALIVDGGVLANYPIATFGDNEELETTIGFKLVSQAESLPPHRPKNIGAYIMRIIETMQVALERIYVKKAKWARTIPIPTGTISTIDFGLTEENKQFLWKSGHEAADSAIKDGLLTSQGRKSY